MDRAAQIVAINVRYHRARARLSLAQLAKRSGVAKATLSSLEAGAGNPTIQTLWAIADALGTSFSDLLVEPAEGVEVKVTRLLDDLAPPVDAQEVIELYARWPGRGVTETYLLSLGAGARYEATKHAAGAVEHLVVTEGHMRGGPASSPVNLGTYDYVRFPADQDHLYESVAGPARCVLIISYPVSGP
jgi:transcriptional regulator with XRE-family HTH domain